MKTTKIAAIGGASIVAVLALLLAYPAMAATNGLGYPLGSSALANIASAGTTSSSTSQNIIPTSTALTVGQTITFTSTNGAYKVVGTPGKAGTASGTMVLTVTGVFKGGYALSLTSGSLTLTSSTAGATSAAYTMGAGSAEMGPHETQLVGQGSLTTSTPGSFLFSAGAHANFQGNTYNTLRLDVQVGGVEYGVLLLATSQVS